MDFATLTRFLIPALQAILPRIDSSTPAGKIAQIVLNLLPMFASQASSLARLPMAKGTIGAAAPPVQLPPQQHWTSPEALLEWAESQPSP